MGKCLNTFTGHKAGIWCCHVNPKGGNIVATASPDKTIKLWDVNSGKIIDDVQAHKNKAYWVQFSIDGTLLTSCGSDKTIHVWDAKKLGSPLSSFEMDYPYVTSCSFLDGKDFLVACSFDGWIYTYDLNSKDRIGYECIVEEEMMSNYFYSVKQFRTEKNKRFIISGHEDKTIGIWELNDQDRLELQAKLKGHTSSVRYAASNLDDTQILSGCEEGSLRIWNLKEKETEFILIGHKDFVSSADCINEKTIVTGSWDKRVNVYILKA